MTMLLVQWDWNQMLWTALIGFSLVIFVLYGLVWIMKAFGAIFKPRRAVEDPGPELTMVSEEEVAAIAVALRLYHREKHDLESEVLTMLSIKRAYSPWNSKIHGLTPLPDRK